MNLEINFNWELTTVKPGVRTKLGNKAKGNIHRFFNKYDGNIGLIELAVLRVESGANSQQIIKVCSQNDSLSVKTIGVQVMISVEGSLSITALMTMKGRSLPNLRNLLENGPYFAKQKKSKMAVQSIALQEVTPPVAAKEIITPTDKVFSDHFQPSVVKKTLGYSGKTQPVQPVSSKSKTASPLLADLPVEQVDHLKSVLALILLRAIPDLSNVPHTFQLPVVVLRKILEETEPDRDPNASKRGLFTRFFTYQIRIFAIKLTAKDSQDPNSKYPDWLFDGNTIVQFIDGVNNIPSLTTRFKIATQSAIPENTPAYVCENKTTNNPTVHSIQPSEEVKEIEMSSDVLAMVRVIEDKNKAIAALTQACAKEGGLHVELISLQNQLDPLLAQVTHLNGLVAQVTALLDEAVTERKAAQDVVDRTGTLSEEKKQEVRAFLLDLASQV